MKRSKHSLSHYRLQSQDMGELVPCGLVEVLPGDTMQAASTALVRASPLLAPVMHPVDVRLHWWFVPHRLVWDGWEDFITGGPDNDSRPDFPTISAGASQTAVGSLGDYLGVPPGSQGSGASLPVSALPYRGYALIWNEWYRDQDLQEPVRVSTASGVDVSGSGTSRVLLNCAWEKDYFTSARPWEQKGPDITIPLGTEAPVLSDGTQVQAFTQDTDRNIHTRQADGTRPGEVFVSPPGSGSASDDFVFGANTGLYADLSEATGISVIELREILSQQRWAEHRARFGSRYVEYLRFLGVRSSDARLQRPEYLGGGKQTIQFSEVLQTAPEDSENPVGSLKGHGIGVTRSRRWRRYFEEHGYIFCLASVRPKTIYTQGLKRTFNRRTREDFFQREFAHVGQQAVLNKEVYARHSSPDGIFGYQDRYDEYRRQESDVAGEFRTSLLDYWHMGRIFDGDVALNADFVEAVPTQRIFASSTNDVLYCMFKHSIQARRIVPRTGTSRIM